MKTESAPRTSRSAVRLVAAHVAGEPGHELDETQRAVVETRTGSGSLVVTGGPGTGKTSTLLEAVSARVLRDGLDPGSVLVLAPTRVAAGGLRERLARRLTAAGAAALLEPPARTAASYAFSLIRRHALGVGEPSPQLISGPEQDVILADLLAGHADGDGLVPVWPDQVSPALGLRGFRHELRDLLMRAMERGVDPDELARLGRQHRRPVWRAAAVVYREYLQVTALSTPGAYDPAAIVDHASALLAADAGLLAAERARWRLIAVDDHHESGEALARLLDQLAPPGADLLVFGDPDATTQSFRGAQSRLMAQAATRYPTLRGPAPEVVLGTCWRYGPSIGAAAGRIVARIGALGPGTAARRAARPAPGLDPGRVRVQVSRSSSGEAAIIASTLRSAHLRDGVPWAQMAVLVRSAGQTAALRRALAQAGVPVAVPTADLPLRDEPAVRPLLAVTAAALDPALLDDPDTVEALLTSVGGADGLSLRRLRRWLSLHHRVAGDDLLCRVLASPVLLDGAPAELALPVHRLVEVLRAGAQAGRDPAASAQTVLWAVWQATGWPTSWRAAALTGGRAGRRADRDLDAVLTLFEAAARFAVRLPASGPQEFLARLGDQDLPEDTLAARAPSDGAVTLTTPQGAAGGQWGLVVVAGVQEGVWPNTRLRGSLLGSTDLVDLLSGRQVGSGPADPTQQRAARREVLHDELRMFYVAVTRAASRLLVTAVSNADQVPSPFLDLIDPTIDERVPVAAPRALSLPSVVAQLRVELTEALAKTATGRADRAATLLARLAAEGVPGADPRHWYGLAGWSDEAPLAVPDRPVRVSPSAIESFRDCPLRWLLDTGGGRPPAPPAVGIGTLIHDLSHELPQADADTLVGELRERWPELGLAAGWVSDRLLTRAEAMLIRLAGYRRTATLVASEVEFTVRIGEAVLSGRIDRLERDTLGRLVAVDIKTGSSAPTKAEVARHPQLGAYQLAVDAGAFDDLLGAPAEGGGAKLLQLGTGTKAREQPQPPLAADPQPEWARDLVEQVSSAMAGSRFPATVQSGCRHCPVRSSCPAQPEGRQVGS